MTLPGLEEQPDPTMTPEEVQAAVSRMLDEARAYSEDVLSDFRAKATSYYKGEPFGNEVDGRSQFVCTELKDTVQAILPSLVDIFSGSERTVEFRPERAEDVAQAEQQTDTVNYVVNKQNRGHLTRYAAFKDALVRRLGVVKYWHEPGESTVTEESFTGLSDPQVQLLNNDPSVLSGAVTGSNPQPDGSFLYDLTLRRLANKDGRIRVEAVPPDEFVFSPNAKSKDDALCVAHVTRIRKGELVRMGYSETTIDEAGTAGRARSLEYAARQPLGVVQEADDGENPEIDYAEVYCYLDVDGDGVAENRRVVVLGASTVVANDPFEGRPFALYCTDPEPHSIVPQSVADGTMDLQLLNSALIRNILDSAATTLRPRREVVETQVTISDLLNDEIGAIDRVRAPGMINNVVIPFVGKEILPMLLWTAETKENRFGISKASMGLNPDALQSSTKAAVAATVSGSQQHLKLMAMMLAEGEREVYEGVRNLLIQHQDRAMTIRLRNEYVEVDPRTWNASMDCVVNVGLGSGTKDERLAVLEQIAQRQEGILKMLGPSNPLVTLGQYRETLAKMCELAGEKDASKYWKPLPPDWEPPPVQPKPTPEETYAAIEQMKVQADIANKQATLAQQERQMELDAQKAAWDHEEAMLKLALDREKLAAESGLREREIDLAAVNEETRTNAEASRPAEQPREPQSITIVTGEQAAQMPAPVIKMDAPVITAPPPVTSITVKRDGSGKAARYDLKRGK